MADGDLFGQFVESDASDAGGGAGEVFVDDVLVQADGFEQLCATVAHDGGDAHLAMILSTPVDNALVRFFTAVSASTLR